MVVARHGNWPNAPVYPLKGKRDDLAGRLISPRMVVVDLTFAEFERRYSDAEVIDIGGPSNATHAA